MPQAQRIAPPFPSCVTSGKLGYFSKTEFSHPGGKKRAIMIFTLKYGGPNYMRWFKQITQYSNWYILILLILLELLPGGGGSDRVQKVKKRQVASKNLISNSIFSGPGGKKSQIYTVIHWKESLRYLKSMKLELQLERILDQYFNFE